MSLKTSLSSNILLQRGFKAVITNQSLSVCENCGQSTSSGLSLALVQRPLKAARERIVAARRKITRTGSHQSAFYQATHGAPL